MKCLLITYIICIFQWGVLDASPAQFNSYFINAAKRVKPSVVSIRIYDTTDDTGEPAAYGSGTVITRSGYIVTNFHVIKKGVRFKIVLHTGLIKNVKILSNGKYYLADPKTDIALMKIAHVNSDDMTPITFANSNKLSDGEWVLAIGSPYGLRQTITSGVVSSKGRDNIGFADIEDFIQTDVPINPGNSGGPLINLYGKMVGINTAIRTNTGSYQGISFAIPSNIVKQVYYELLRYGRVRRGWLGFLALEKQGYIKVISVIKKSPAFNAGIRKGDFIHAIDGHKVISLGTIIKYVGSKSVGSKIRLTLSRDGVMHNFTLMLREKREYVHIWKHLQKLLHIYGFEIDEKVSDGTIIISYINPMKGLYYNLKKGDIVLRINGRSVSSLENFFKLIQKLNWNIQTLKISRQGRTFLLTFKKTSGN